MEDQFLHKKFIFNDKIDSAFLNSLYEDDFVYIEEIFKTTLDQLNPLMSEIPIVFNNNDTKTLKRIIHKIKPAFGFTGFLVTETACKEFEDSCSESTNSNDLASLYNPLMTLMAESRDIMEQQYEQIKEFNAK
jgi:chemotaxis protein histidine kinase CheA